MDDFAKHKVNGEMLDHNVSVVSSLFPFPTHHARFLNELQRVKIQEQADIFKFRCHEDFGLSQRRSITVVQNIDLSDIKEIGQGHFAVAFSATWSRSPTISEEVVIKVPKNAMGPSEWNEFQVLQQVPAHPNILPFIGLCSDFSAESAKVSAKNKVCLVTSRQSQALKDVIFEKRKNQTQALRAQCPESPSTCDALNVSDNGYASAASFSHDEHLDWILNTAKDIARGLDHLHEEGGFVMFSRTSQMIHCTNINTQMEKLNARKLTICSVLGWLHRDLADRNILISPSGSAVISDFGLSRQAESKHGVSGEPYYRLHPQSEADIKLMAPETLNQNIYTRKSDIWMLGVCIWQLIALKEPYGDLNSHVVCSLVKNNSTCLLNPEYFEGIGKVDPALLEILRGCLSYDPNARPDAEHVVWFMTCIDFLKIQCLLRYSSWSSFSKVVCKPVI